MSTHVYICKWKYAYISNRLIGSSSLTTHRLKGVSDSLASTQVSMALLLGVLILFAYVESYPSLSSKQLQFPLIQRPK